MSDAFMVTLDGAAPKRRFLTADTAVGGQAVMRLAIAGEIPVGVTDATDMADETEFRFVIGGRAVWQVEAGAAVAPGDFVAAGAAGRAVPVAEGDRYAVAMALDVGVAPAGSVPGTMIRVAPLRTVGLGAGGGGGGGSTAWADITGKPATFPPAIGATASTAVAGNDPRLTAGAAATATVRAIGTAATTAAAGDHTHTGLTADAAAGTASIRTLGTAATSAAAGNHTHTGLLTGTATAVNNSTATDAAGAVTDFNALLAVLRTRGIITGT
ncbi:hypothetical protein ACIO3R_07240 [Streptomyces sp. NPDC087428]|uniref:hypothetical protein n=1 Tax=Streptomyces sp. NPDC087428 TaxID=3365788 RepID=UPI00382B5330